MKIENEEDYDLALNRLSEIFDSKEGTPEFTELLNLIDVIEKYEEIMWPIWANEDTTINNTNIYVNDEPC